MGLMKTTSRRRAKMRYRYNPAEWDQSRSVVVDRKPRMKSSATSEASRAGSRRLRSPYFVRDMAKHRAIQEALKLVFRAINVVFQAK